MAEAPKTQASLLVRIRDLHDEDAWEQFVEIYGPVVFGFARRRGLQAADAGDLTQEVLRAIAGAAEWLDYDPRKGTFRGWLFTVARNKLHDFLRARVRQCQGSGDSAVEAVLAEQPAASEEAHWEEEHRQQLFDWAAKRVRDQFEEKTWQAFWRVAVEGRSPQEMAAELNTTLAAVYMAKSRVLAALKNAVHELLGDDAAL